MDVGIPVQRSTTSAICAGPTFLLDQLRLLGALCRFHLLLKLGDHAVGKLTRALEVALALGLFELGLRPVQLLLHVAARFEPVALGLPLRRHLGRLLLEVRKLALELLEPVLRGLVVLLLQRLPLDLHLQDLPSRLVKSTGSE